MTGLSCSFEFSGYSDYWGGYSGRGCGHGCAFAYYGRDTTLRDLVDQWIEDAWGNEYDFEDLPESVTSDDIRECILESLTAQGRADYASGALCSWAADYGDERECRDCGAGIGCEHEDNCAVYDENNGLVVEDDCDDCEDYCESPVVIIEIDWTDHPDYKPESDWELCHHDDGHFLWSNKYGRETGPYSTEEEAWNDCPDCPILKEERGL